jgi:hypothetical protein
VGAVTIASGLLLDGTQVAALPVISVVIGTAALAIYDWKVRRVPRTTGA